MRLHGLQSPLRASGRPLLLALGLLVLAGGVGRAAMPNPGGPHTVTSAKTYNANNQTTTVTYTLTTGNGTVRDFHLMPPAGQKWPDTGTGTGQVSLGSSGGTGWSQGTKKDGGYHWAASQNQTSGAQISFTVTIPGNKTPEGDSPYFCITNDGALSTIRSVQDIRTKDPVTGWGPAAPADGGVPASGPLIPPFPLIASIYGGNGSTVPIGGSLSVDLVADTPNVSYAVYASSDLIPCGTTPPWSVTLSGASGTLDSSGEATVTITAPNDPGLEGKVLYLFFVTIENGRQRLISTPSELVFD